MQLGYGSWAVRVVGAVVSGILLVPLSAAGQQAQQEEPAAGQEHEHQEDEPRSEREGITDIHIEEEVTVTGTAIHEAPIDAPYAVAMVSRDAIEQAAGSTVTDLFKNLTASSGVIGETNSWYNDVSVGIPESAANVNLRGLGASRTLVLLNGRRQVYVPGRLAGGRFVDVNAFPTMAIERIDVLKEGAGAVYGSDAIAGVVNFVTRGAFEGFEFKGSYDYFADAGDGSVGAIWGHHFENGPHIVASFDHQRRAKLTAPDREGTLRPYPGWGWGWSGTGNPGAFIVPPGPEANVDILSAAPRFLDPDCEGIGGYPDAGSRTCRFRYQPWDSLIAGTEFARGFVELHGDPSERFGYRVEALYADARIPEWETTPSFPPVSLLNGAQIVTADHPGRQAFAASYPSIADTAGGALDLTGDQPWHFFGRLVGNAGPGRRLARQNRTRRLHGSLHGELGLSDLRYDVGVSWSDSRGNVNQPAEYAYRKFLAFRGYGGPNCGVGVVADPAADSGMALGAIPAGVRPGQGNCMYFNPFGNSIQFSAQPGSYYENNANPSYRDGLGNSPELIRWINDEVDLVSETSLTVIDATLNGVAREGVASYALGYQFRYVDASATPNDVGNLLINPCPVPGDTSCALPSGLFTFTNSEMPYQADQGTHALFAELALNASERLDTQLAAHYERYEFASSLDPKVSASFRLAENLALRGTVQTTFRTPSVDDLNTSAYTFLNYVPASGTYKAVDSSGSQDLLPEEAFTWNVGLVFGDPDTGLEGSVDFWNFDFDNPISLLPYTGIAAAYADPARRPMVQDLITCPGNRRDGSCAAAELERIRVTHVNWPGIRTSGFDLRLGYRTVLGLGALVATADASFTRNFDVDALSWNGAEIVPDQKMAGFLNWGNPVAPPLPKLKGNTTLSYFWGHNSVFGAARYISSYEDRSGGEQYGAIDSFLTFDATFQRQFPELGMAVRLSALNLLNRWPPVVNAELNYDGLTHDFKGRRIKLAVTYAFGS